MSYRRRGNLRHYYHGKGKCRWCGQDAKRYDKRRRAYCSDACSHEVRVRTDIRYVRRCLRKRDRQVCVRCGFNAPKLARILKHAHTQWRAGDRRVQWYRGMAPAIAAMGFHPKRGFAKAGDFWDADHIVPVCAGGGECGLDGYQTLCCVCHYHKTLQQKFEAGNKRHGNGQNGNV